MLAAMATATSRIRLGCQVTGMPYRHPSVLANIAATTDIISRGRLIIGLGAGWNQDESDALGIRLPPLKERMDQFEEGVQVIIALLSQPRANFSGQHFTLTDAWCEPKPIQRPHPPIAIGGNGERRTLRIVARFAQHWNSTLTDLGEWRHKCEVLERHCAEVGRDPTEIERSVNVRPSCRPGPAPAATDDRTMARCRRRRVHRRSRYPSRPRFGPTPRSRPGRDRLTRHAHARHRTPDQNVDVVARRRHAERRFRDASDPAIWDVLTSGSFVVTS